jgi:flagellar biosynthesis/type III secretory pathway M-ring protein FliF/YscJ
MLVSMPLHTAATKRTTLSASGMSASMAASTRWALPSPTASSRAALNKKGILLNRKMLSELAEKSPESFARLIKKFLNKNPAKAGFF